MEPLRFRLVVLNGQHWECLMPHEEHGHTVETAVEARAGFLDRPVLLVLLASIAVVVIGFALTWVGVSKI
jgi:hypothetical protein